MSFIVQMLLKMIVKLSHDGRPNRIHAKRTFGFFVSDSILHQHTPFALTEEPGPYPGIHLRKRCLTSLKKSRQRKTKIVLSFDR